MNDASAPDREAELDEARDRSLQEDLRQLLSDARALADAEFAYQKTRATYAGKESAKIALLGTITAVFVFFALMALVLGAVIALAPALTPWGATGTVTGLLLLLALACAGLAKVRLTRMKDTISDKKES